MVVMARAGVGAEEDEGGGDGRGPAPSDVLLPLTVAAAAAQADKVEELARRRPAEGRGGLTQSTQAQEESSCHRLSQNRKESTTHSNRPLRISIPV